MTCTQLRSAHVSASGTVIDFPTRIRAIWIYTGANSGDVVVSVDTGQPTAVNHTIPVKGSSTDYIDFTGTLGLRAASSVAITLPTAAKATLFYG